MNIEEIFTKGRTCYDFAIEREVSPKLLQEIYELMKFGPTSANSSPLRIKFVASFKAREELISCLNPGNIEHTKTAPVTALFAYDTKYYTKMDKLFPQGVAYQEFLASNPEVAYTGALRNSSLQAAYFMIVARSKGLACGPMSGFDEDKINKTFFPNGEYKVNFICNLGYARAEAKYPRLPRLDFTETCVII